MTDIIQFIHQHQAHIILAVWWAGMAKAVYDGRKDHEPAEDLSWVRKQWRYSK